MIMNCRSDDFKENNPVEMEDGELKIKLRLLVEHVRLSLMILLLQMRLKIFQSSLTVRQKVMFKKLLRDCRECRILLNIYPLLMKI
jgi:hypothetical protein